MVGALLLLASLPLAPARADTVVEMRRGDHVVVENLSGEISVRVWDRDRLEVQGGDEDAPAGVSRSGSRVRVGQRGGRGRRRVELSIRVPPWVSLEITGRSLDVTVSGVEGRTRVSNISGDVWVEDGGGAVEVRTVEGEIDVVDVRGDVSVSSQSDDVRVRRVRGRVEAHSGNGDVTLTQIEGSSVRAETQDGDIDYDGTIERGGTYGFFVHDGSATVALPESAGAQVSVSTFDGEFESEFPVVIQRYRGGREFDFTMGDGGARVTIQVFDGEIRLLQRR